VRADPPRPAGSFAGEFTIDTGLLKQLRIEGAQREDRDGGPPKWVWGLVAGLLGLALLGGAAWWVLAGNKPVAVQAVTVRANGQGPSADAVLQATGYVTGAALGHRLGTDHRHADRGADRRGLPRQEGPGAGPAGRQRPRRRRWPPPEAQGAAPRPTVAQLRAQLAQAEADARRQAELARPGMTTRQSQEQARPP
jgi:hypothetical protein